MSKRVSATRVGSTVSAWMTPDRRAVRRHGGRLIERHCQPLFLTANSRSNATDWPAGRQSAHRGGTVHKLRSGFLSLSGWFVDKAAQCEYHNVVN